MSKRGRIIVCSRCERERRNNGRGLCESCYNMEYRKSRSRIIICKECQEETHHCAKELCEKCYTRSIAHKFLDKRAESERKRRADNPELVREQDRQRNQTEKRKKWKREYHQSWYAANKERVLAYQVEYRRGNLARQANYKRRRRARVLGLPDTLTVQEWQEILQAHNHACAYCGARGGTLEREHKIPAAKGGGFTAENIVPACPTCNRRKQTMTDEEFRQYLIDYPR